MTTAERGDLRALRRSTNRVAHNGRSFSTAVPKRHSIGNPAGERDTDQQDTDSRLVVHAISRKKPTKEL